MSEIVTAAPAANTVAAPAAAPQTTSAAHAAKVSGDAPAKAEAAPAAKTAPELYDVTIDGKVEKMTLDELRRHASLGKGSNKRFEEAAKMRREAEEIVADYTDPKKVLRRLQDPKFGLTKEQITASMEEWYKENVIDPSEMTPEQRKLSEAEKRIKAFEEKEAAEAKKLEEEEEGKRDRAEAEKIQKEVMDAVDASGLPKTQYTARRLAYWMRNNEAKGIRAPAELLVQQVRGEMESNIRSLINASDGEMLEKLVGDDGMKKIRRLDLERIRQRRGQGAGTLTTPKPIVDNAPPQSESISVEEVQRRLRDPKLWQ